VPKDKLDIDLAARLPIGDTWGDGAYHIVMYHYGANHVYVEPTPDRSHASLTAALERGLRFFADRNITSTFAVLDNEFNTEKFKNLMRKNNLPFQLVPRNSHRRNMAERTIRTWKNHFGSTLLTTDKRFPLAKANLLLP
jgi:hypothetical protein